MRTSLLLGILQAQGRRAVVVQCDVSDEGQVEAMFDRAERALGTLDILMNNAAVDASGKKVVELSTEVFDRAIRVNVYGYFFCCRRFAQIRTAAGGGGKIVNVTSVHEDVPNAGGRTTTGSKGALRMLTRTLALELAPLRVNVNSLAPGMVLTPFSQAAIDDPELLEKQVQSIPGSGLRSRPRSPASPCSWPAPTLTR